VKGEKTIVSTLSTVLEEIRGSEAKPKKKGPSKKEYKGKELIVKKGALKTAEEKGGGD